MARLLAGELDEHGYRGLLAAQWRLLSAWEAERAGDIDALRVRHGWPYASRAEALACDLAAMGVTPATARERGLDTAPLRGRPASPDVLAPEAWGQLYVVEGSALGGRFIVKLLRRKFPALPHRFYGVGEQATGPWRRFQSLLDQALGEPSAIHAAVEGARRMFARYQQTLQDDAAHV